MSFPLKYKNEKEIWWEDEYGYNITIEIIDAENEQYIERGYWDKGQLSYKINYRKGQKHGEYLVLYDSGQLCYKINYHQGQRHGEFARWKDGKLLYKAKYDHGELIDEKRY